MTINNKGIFIGGEPATHYLGEKILYPKDVQKNFNDIQEQSPFISDMHVFLSKTPGKENEVGQPVAEPGAYTWSRLVVNGVPVDCFVCSSSFCTAAEVADITLRWARNNTDFRLKMLRAAKQAVK